MPPAQQSRFQTNIKDSPFSQPLEESKQPLWKEYWYVLAMAFAFILLIISYVIRLILPPTPPPDQSNNWNGITPGYSSLQDVTSVLGEPVGTKRTAQGNATVFESHDYSAPHEIITNQQGTVTFAKEYLPYNPDNVLSTYVEEFGQPDLSLYNHQGNSANLNHVFLDEGVVIVAHAEEDIVFERWFFEPTNEATFLRSWGQSLEPEPEGPEHILP